MKLNQWLEEWQKSYIKFYVKYRTLFCYNNLIKNHIKPILGDYELEELLPNVLKDFVLQKLECGNLQDNQPLSINTVHLIVNLLKQIISDAVAEKVTQVNFTNTIKLPSPTQSKVTAFEKSEQAKLEKYCFNNKKSNYIGIVICLYTGIRIGELLALTWNDIDFKNSCMSISKTVYQIKKDNKYQILIDTPKTKNSNRIIPLSKILLDRLKQIKKNSKSNYVITTNKSTIVGVRSYQKTFKTILNKLNIPYKNFHSLRHTFATRALEFGIDVKTLSEILGHKNPIITLERYTHSLNSYKFSVMNKFGNLIHFD